MGHLGKCKSYTGNMAAAAMGKKKAQLVLKNGKVLQVFTGELMEADVAVEDGVIVGVGSFEGEREVDVTGKYIVPGFMDSHLHLESTLVNPAELILQAGLFGTTTFVVDPHEAANVCGNAGIQYILDATEGSQANVFVMMPSCVPSADFEDNGCRLTAEDMKEYHDHPRILGLGEVMDCFAVIDREEGMMAKLDLFRDKVMDGHAGYLGEKETGCYALSGISTDHECCSFEDALREARAGMQILIREGTAAKNLEAIVTGIVREKLPCHSFAFCTDDKHIEDIKRDGHISYNIKKAVSLGIDVIEAYKMASFYPTRHYGLKNLGAVAPGYQADLVVLSDLEKVEIEQVYWKGQRLSEDRKPENIQAEERLLHTVHVKMTPDMFKLPLTKEEQTVIEIVPREILTKKSVEKVKVENGFFAADETFQKIAVLERHKATGKTGLGILKGFGVRKGAIASTVGHDSHNLIVVGDNDEDMRRAVEALVESGGGYTVVRTGKEPMTLPLEVMGLMSQKPHEEVEERLKEMIKEAREMGVPETNDPFITMSFLALPVIPALRITPRGLYDVENRQFIFTK